MKKTVFSVLLALLAAMTFSFAAFAEVSVEDEAYYAAFRDKGITLNVYNWGEYISDGSDDSIDVIKEFEVFVDDISNREDVRPLVSNTIKEFMTKPLVYIKNEFADAYEEIKDKMPPHRLDSAANKTSFSLEFDDLDKKDFQDLQRVSVFHVGKNRTEFIFQNCRKFERNHIP